MKRRPPLAEINVVPYIDVMLVLLVIFMVTTPLLTQGVKVTLPKARAETIQKLQQKPIIVTINAKGEYFLNMAAHPDKPLSLVVVANQIAAQLQFAKRMGEKIQVFVKGDSEVDYGKVVTAMAFLQQAGVKQVGLITHPVSQHLQRG